MRKSDFVFRYHIRNRPAWNRALMRRGSITFWDDDETKEIVAVDLTASNIHDGLLEQIMGKVGQVSGDRAYHTRRCYRAILARGVVPAIPLRCNARSSAVKDPPLFKSVRDAVLCRIKSARAIPEGSS